MLVCRIPKEPFLSLLKSIATVSIIAMLCAIIHKQNIASHHYILLHGWCLTNRETMNIQKGSKPSFAFLDWRLFEKEIYAWLRRISFIRFHHCCRTYCWTSEFEFLFLSVKRAFRFAILLLKKNWGRNKSKGKCPRIVCIVDYCVWKKWCRSMDTNG